jgi:hypothetical protein
VALYTADGSGYPQSLLSLSSLQSCASPSQSFVPVTMPSTSLSLGTTYCLCACVEAVGGGGLGYYGEVGGGPGLGSAILSGNSLANTPTSPSISGGNTLSIYADYCMAMTPTPTVTPTVTYTPTITDTPCGSPANFGYTTFNHQYNDDPPHYTLVWFSDYTAPASGTLRAIHVAVDSDHIDPATVQVALYSVNGSGYPQNLLSICPPQRLGTSSFGIDPATWPVFSNMQAVPLVSGTTYAVCVWEINNTGSTAMYFQYGNDGTNFGIATLSGGSLANTPTSPSFSGGTIEAVLDYCP